MNSWQSTLLEPVKVVLSQIGQFLTNVLLVIIILIIGWILSTLIRSLVTRLLKAVKLDILSERVELDILLEKGGIGYTLSELIGVVAYWLSLLITVMVAVNAIGLTIVADLLNTVVLYVPNIVAAVIILIMGMFIATFLRNVVQTASINAGLSQNKLISKAVEVVVIVFSIIMALEQLNIGAKIIELTVMILLGAMGLAVALAFGLGCKEAAGKLVNDIVNKLKK
jgi:small-conductance mechanosensitive channel